MFWFPWLCLIFDTCYLYIYFIEIILCFNQRFLLWTQSHFPTKVSAGFSFSFYTLTSIFIWIIYIILIILAYHFNSVFFHFLLFSFLLKQWKFCKFIIYFLYLDLNFLVFFRIWIIFSFWKFLLWHIKVWNL
jgi:hypothetical protein